MGGVISPLLANVLLDQLDKELERRGHVFARYADDVLILVRSQRAGERVKASVARFLRRRLRLEVNELKSRVCGVEDVEFLGFVFRGGRIVWSADSFEHFKYRVRRLTNRSWGVSMRERLRRLTLFVRGWMNYSGISEYYRPIPEIDKWIRRRVRMCYWKQWRRPRTKIRNLLALGASRSPSHLDRSQQQELLASVADLVDPVRNDQPVVSKARAHLSQRALDCTCSSA